ncbi:MAG TPA: alpha/beta hydrolase [Jatrophihabitantaceae bacterium]|nr:alpha/beta hydrolase [Jatrophihabitantaceae bacterium]
MTSILHRRGGGRISYKLTGDDAAPLVILGHGMADSSATFRFLVPRLADAGYRVANVDLRGHGESSTGWPDYTTTAVASDFLALIDELGGAPAAIVGNSYSAGAAVIAAHQRPSAISALVLTGAAVRTPKPANLLMRLTQSLVTRGPLGLPLWLGWYDKKLWPKGKPADYAEQYATLKANLGQKGRMASAQAMMRAGHDRSAAVIGEVTTPALVVMGSADPDFPDPLQEADWVANSLGGPVEKLIIEGVGHYPQAEDIDTVAPAVISFLAKTHPAQ